MTFVQIPAPQENRGSHQFSKLARAAIVLAAMPVLAVIVVGLHALQIRLSPKQGWDGFGQAMSFAITSLIALIAGTISAALAVILGVIAMKQVRQQPQSLSGFRTARAAAIMGGASLVLCWGGIAIKTAIYEYRRAPIVAAEADISAAYYAATQFAAKNGSFPNRLEQVTSAEVARRYVYFAQGLPAKYANYQTPGSPSIVVMHTRHDINGIYVAVCANGMTHEWKKSVLDKALRASDVERNNYGVPATATNQPAP